MILRHASLVLSFLTFALSLVTFIASEKYAAWAGGSIPGSGSAMPIIFYAGTVPLLTLIQATLQIACLHFYTYLSSTFVLAVAVLATTAWIAQATIWTICELPGSIPGTRNTPSPPLWCPQHAFKDHGGDLDVGLTIFKDILGWIMLVASLATAILAFLTMRQESRGKRSHEFHELVEIPPTPPSKRAPPIVRPYSSTFQPVKSGKAPVVNIQPVPSQF